MTTVIAESLSADSLDLETLLELSCRSDPVGVLSVYLDARPGESAQAATIDLKNRLAELERRLANDEPPELARAVHDAIARLAGEIGRLIDPEQRGRGRVLFAAIDDTWVTRVSTQMALPNRVVFERSPFIHPLLELLDEGGPAGVVLASRAEARLLEWRLGELVPLRELRAELIEPPHERPVPSDRGRAAVMAPRAASSAMPGPATRPPDSSSGWALQPRGWGATAAGSAALVSAGGAAHRAACPGAVPSHARGRRA